VAVWIIFRLLRGRVKMIVLVVESVVACCITTLLVTYAQ
jgi:hypothetical protein